LILIMKMFLAYIWMKFTYEPIGKYLFIISVRTPYIEVVRIGIRS